MAAWRFFDYVNARNENEILAWISSLPKKAQAKIDNRILVLQAYEGSWPPLYVSALKGYKDIFELRIGFSGVQYRPLGFFGPGEREFTLLIGAIEKGKLSRRDCETAVDRMRSVRSDRSRVHEHEFS